MKCQSCNREFTEAEVNYFINSLGLLKDSKLTCETCQDSPQKVELVKQ